MGFVLDLFCLLFGSVVIVCLHVSVLFVVIVWC